VWFEYNGVPLKWHYPVGVLFDLIIDDPSTALPWPLTVHFHGFPSAELMRCPNDEAIRSLYTNALKEANYLKHGDGGRVNKLSLDDSNNLWNGLLRHEFDTFWSANDKLVCALPDDLKSVPLRLCERDRPATQVLFEPLTAANAHRSLADLLRSVYPDRFSSLLDTAPNNGQPVLALVQGVAPPLATSVFWLATHFSHPDNFLYIVIKTR
jgi:autophagy-related protein 5